jgi:hypothetical protein
VSKLEENISRAMAGHDDEAPRAADLLRALEQASPPRRHLGWYVPFMVAAAVAVVVAGSVWAAGLLGGHKQAPVSGGAIPVQRLLSCPASYAHQAPWVPAQPAGIDGRSRLVPQITPSSALLCAYRGSNTARPQVGWALSGQRPLAGGLASLASQLTHAHLRLPGPGLGAQPAADPPLDPRLFRHARPFRGLRDFLLLP